MSEKKGGGSRKKSRNIEWCKTYRMFGRRELNKRKKIERHIKKFPADMQAQNRLRSINDKARNAA